ncbi:MAG: hypothetical protein R3F10_10195 [Lysobacteraceae bacterium]
MTMTDPSTPLHDPVNLVELGVEKGASAVLMPAILPSPADRSVRRHGNTHRIQFYADARDCLLKAIQD